MSETKYEVISWIEYVLTFMFLLVISVFCILTFCGLNNYYDDYYTYNEITSIAMIIFEVRAIIDFIKHFNKNVLLKYKHRALYSRNVFWIALLLTINYLFYVFYYGYDTRVIPMILFIVLLVVLNKLYKMHKSKLEQAIVNKMENITDKE